MRVLFLVLAFTQMACATDLYTEIHGDGTYTVAEEVEASRRARAIGEDIARGGYVRLAERSEEALDGILQIAIRNLKRKGHRELARELEADWRYYQGTLIVLSLNMGKRDIGDFEPLSQWLAEAYEKIEAALGYDICRALRLSDLKTLNYGLRVVFQPCQYGESEFSLHFIHDAKYRGVFPVVSYWATSVTCSIATFGAGYFFVCSPIAMLVELGADRVVAPWLSPKLYNLACE